MFYPKTDNYECTHQSTSWVLSIAHQTTILKYMLWPINIYFANNKFHGFLVHCKVMDLKNKSSSHSFVDFYLIPPPPLPNCPCVVDHDHIRGSSIQLTRVVYNGIFQALAIVKLGRVRGWRLGHIPLKILSLVFSVDCLYTFWHKIFPYFLRCHQNSFTCLNL